MVVISELDFGAITESTCDESQPDQDALNGTDFDSHGLCTKLAHGDEKHAPIACAEVEKDFIGLQIDEFQGFANALVFRWDGGESINGRDEDPQRTEEEDGNEEDE